MSLKVFYHNDLDGQCAAYWCSYIKNTKKEFHWINYGIPFPFKDININDDVYIVDYSIKPEEMDKLLKITPRVTWIDHHKSAIEMYNGYKKEIRGIRHENGIAGCALTWIYLNKLTNFGEDVIIPFKEKYFEEVPRFTRLVSDWDTWTFRYGVTSRKFQAGMLAEKTEPTEEIWKKLDNYGDAVIRQIVDHGELIIRYRDSWAKGYLEGYGFETEFEGYNCYAVNMGRCNSEYFKSIGGVDKYDILMPFVYNGKTWSVSFYSRKGIDVSKIAQKYGGGGHAGASGASFTELPFKRKGE